MDTTILSGNGKRNLKLVKTRFSKLFSSDELVLSFVLTLKLNLFVGLLLQFVLFRTPGIIERLSDFF